ncbi:MAG: NAD-dependent epimerase/dehydratase family protein [Elusimicrobia bacterium]|nr:NAD-dependent epimerase/dehydratase family protein [Elusimicrobiota bacterium]
MSEFLLKSDVAEICQGLGTVAEAFEGKTVLICGGRGFLGRYFVETFAHLNKHRLRKPAKLIVLDNLITAGKEGAAVAEFPHCRFERHDIIKPFKFKEKPDYIIQAAGIASPFYYRAYPLETLEVAIQGTKNCLDLAKTSGAKIVFFSSSEIYGDPDPKHVPTPESYRGNVSCHGPRACYDESKRLGETLCGIFHTKFGTAVSVIRPFNVYGPGMQETDYRVLPNFANRIKADLPLKVYGSGNQTRTFCYITDALRGFLLALLKGLPGEAYNIGNPKPEISMLELVKISETVLNRRVKHDVVEYPDSYPADEPNRRCPDITKARLQLGYEPKVSLEEGLRRFYGWSEQTYTGQQTA